MPLLCLSFSHTHTSLAASVVSPLLLQKKVPEPHPVEGGGTLRFSWTKARDAVPFLRRKKSPWLFHRLGGRQGRREKLKSKKKVVGSRVVAALRLRHKSQRSAEFPDWNSAQSRSLVGKPKVNPMDHYLRLAKFATT